MSEVKAMTTRDGIQAGIAKGCEVVQSSPEVLLLDIDDEASYERYLQMRPVVEEFFPINDECCWRSSSGGEYNWHVRLTLTKPIEPMTIRLLLQAVLGSDPKKELLSLVMAMEGQRETSLLFRPKEKMGKKTPKEGPYR